MKYIQYVHPKGLLERGKLTLNFMKRKLEEYDELKKELDDQKVKNKKIKVFKFLPKKYGKTFKFYSFKLEQIEC